MNKLKQALKNNEVSLGAWVQIPHPTVVEIIAHNSNEKLDWICIDMEHGAISFESMTNLIRTIEKFDITPVVRIPKNDYIWIHRALDAGAKGLIIPMIKSGQEASEAVSEALYPPLGNRSFGYSRANFYGADFDSYVKTANEEISIIIQIEHIDAINELDFILDVDRVDATFVGPYDLTGSFGMPGDFDDERYSNLLSRYDSKSKDHGVPTGIHVVRPTPKKIKMAKMSGYKMIAVGTDAVFLEEKCREIFDGGSHLWKNSNRFA